MSFAQLLRNAVCTLKRPPSKTPNRARSGTNSSCREARPGSIPHGAGAGLAKRAGNSVMISRRRSSVMAPQAAISDSVRPQPTQSPFLPLTMQTLMQGVDTRPVGMAPI